MSNRQIFHRMGMAGLTALGWLAAAEVSRAGPITYHVQVNTAPLAGQTGDILFQFNPASPATDAAKATVTSFQGQGGVTGPKLAPEPIALEAFSAFVRGSNRAMPPYQEAIPFSS